MKKKRILALVLCLVLVVIGTGCGNKSKKMTNEEKAFELAEQVVKEKITYGTGYVAIFSEDDCSVKLLSSGKNKYEYEVKGKVKLIHPEKEEIYKIFSIVVEFDDELMLTGDFWHYDLNIE